MAVTYNWIHFSDLHFGVDHHDWLWPSFKHKLEEDLKKLSDQVEYWDLIFFTGDLTQSGKVDQFSGFNTVLESLWKILSKGGRSPYLCVIPGNHDLVRPDHTSATAKALVHLWENDADIRTKFWTDSTCEYRQEIVKYFKNFEDWLTNCSVPVLPFNKGLLPGDFSASLQKDTCKLGIIGLNSTFLQITASDFKGRLDLHTSQLNALCNGDVHKWIFANTTNILLTHQPPSWLSPSALSHFRQEIYPPGRFFAQYCGHQHEPEAFEISEMGGLARRGRQAPALFGLERIGDSTMKRIHGYSAGQFIFDQDKALEKIWPRTATLSRNGDLRLCPDNSYELIDDSFVITTFDRTPTDLESEEQVLPVADKIKDDEILPTESTLSILGDQPPIILSQDQLSTCARYKVTLTTQHNAIRKQEQSQLELELRSKKRAWLVADWGVGKEGFLGASFDRLKEPNSQLELFHLQCSDATDIEALETLFTQQFALPLQAFCSRSSAFPNPYLLLEDIHPNLCQGIPLQRLVAIIDAIIDYSPNLRVLAISRKRPEASVVGVIELKPLDVPDVKLYLQNHPDASLNLQDVDVVYKIHERSDGLPRHIDHILKELKVSTLDNVLEAEWANTLVNETSGDPVPRALVTDVAVISKSEDRGSKRSFLLLKVLSLLPYGETIQALKHYLPADPFFAAHALELADLKLLDILPLKSILPTGASQLLSHAGDQDIPKLLKVPRQVRDYVRSLISPTEKLQIINAGAENYFGTRWRTGKIKLRTRPFEYNEYLNSGPGNEFAVIHDLIVSARSVANLHDLRRALKLGISFCISLKSQARFKDCAIVASSILQIIDRSDVEEQWTKLATLNGSSLRMTNKYDDALRFLKEAIEFGSDYLEKSDRGSVFLDIALAEESLGNIDAAVTAAEEVLAYTKSTSGVHLQAQAIIYEHTLAEDEATSKLTELRGLAISYGNTILTNNLSYDLSKRIKSEQKKDDFIEDILKSTGDTYNRIRAIVKKTERFHQTNRTLSKLDLFTLSSAYSYLYSQRLSHLFDRCHACLWKELEERGDLAALVRLFRHTSFIWRIRGADDQESKYLELLDAKKPDAAAPSVKSGVVAELNYFMGRIAQWSNSLLSKA